MVILKGKLELVKGLLVYLAVIVVLYKMLKIGRASCRERVSPRV